MRCVPGRLHRHTICRSIGKLCVKIFCLRNIGIYLKKITGTFYQNHMLSKIADLHLVRCGCLFVLVDPGRALLHGQIADHFPDNLQFWSSQLVVDILFDAHSQCPAGKSKVNQFILFDCIKSYDSVIPEIVRYGSISCLYGSILQQLGELLLGAPQLCEIQLVGTHVQIMEAVKIVQTVTGHSHFDIALKQKVLIRAIMCFRLALLFQYLVLSESFVA